MKKTFIRLLVIVPLSLTFLPIACLSQIDSTFRYKGTNSFIQNVDDAITYQELNYPDDTGEGGELNTLLLWRNFMGSRVCNDISSGEDQFLPLNTAMYNFAKSINNYCPGSTTYDGNWTCMGPFNAYLGDIQEEQGRINAVWVNPNDTNIILVGSDAGGLWKSTNAGTSWSNVTDASASNGGMLIPGCMGVKGIAVDPLNTNIIYLWLGISSQYKKSGGYGIGLVYSTDGGVTWNTDIGFNTAIGSNNPIIDVTKVMYMPNTEKLFALYQGHVLYKASPSSSWADISGSTFANLWCFDIEFTYQTPGKAIVSTSSYGNLSKLCLYDVNNGTWSSLSVTLPSTYVQNDYEDGIVNISLSGTDEVFMIAKAHNSSTNASTWSLWRTPINNINLTALANHPFYINGDLKNFEVSKSNASVIYFSYDQANGINKALKRSVDGGLNITGDVSGGLHVDGRCLFVLSTTNTSDGIDDVVYYGSDGGICKKRAGKLRAESITGSGLAVTEFYGLGSSDADDGVIAAGSHDNSGFTFIKNRPTPWQQIFVNDNFTTRFKKNGIMEAFGEFNDPPPPYSLYKIQFSGLNTTQTVVSPPNDLSISNIDRPLQFDFNNTAFVGFSHIWKMPAPPAQQTWQRAFPNADPIDHISSTDQKMAYSFFINQFNNDTAYVSYRDPAFADPTGQGNDQYGKLYVSVNATGISPTWLNITPYIVKDDGVNCIAVDPANNKRVWIALGNVNEAMINQSPDQMQNRVLYSDNMGQTWHDVSRGLSALPVNKIIYREGSDDELYAGTDAGVYKWNKELQKWECFNNGMPPCIVMDLEINYCAGKLRAATYGRGIWETDILTSQNGAADPSIGDVVPMPASVITGNETWSSSKFISTGILIKSGSILTINGSNTTIHMPKNGTIIVEPGASLIINDATITSDCNRFWKGILVLGNPSLVQTAANQGSAILTNATIEHARVGLCNWGESLPNSYWWVNAGGILQATNCIFKNNARSVSLAPYHNSWSYIKLKNKSFFRQCTFDINDDYRGEELNYPFLSFINMSDVEGVDIIGCTFTNESTMPNTEGTGIGINSWNAGYSVIPACPTSANYFNCNPSALIPNMFSGLQVGVSANGDINNIANVVWVDYANFDKTALGVYAASQTSLNVFNSIFNIGNASKGYCVNSVCNYQIGLYALASPKFRIENNKFLGNSSSFTTEGALVIDCDVTDKDIYKNDFNYLKYGVDMRGVNGSYADGYQHGLQLLCDNFLGTAPGGYDYTITKGGFTNQNAYSFIRRDQGNNGGSSTGNTYNNGPTITGGKANNATGNTLYNYYYNNSQYIGVQFGPFNNIITGGNNGCPIRTYDYPDVLGPQKREIHESNLIDYINSYNVALDNFNLLIDNGDTPGLLSSLSNYSDAENLLNALSSISPFLSEQVLRAVAQGDYLSTEQLMQLLEVNPEVVRNYAFLSFLQNDIPHPLSQEQIDQLKGVGQNHSTDRTDKEGNLFVLRQNIGLESHELISAIKSDTSGLNTDTLAYWYDQIPEKWAKYALAAINLDKGLYSDVTDALRDIPTQFDLSDTIACKEYASYGDLFTLLQSVKQDGRQYDQMTLAENNTLLDIANRSHGYPSYSALAMYNQHMNISPYVCNTDPIQGNWGAGKKQVSLASQEPSCKVYPNPAKDFAYFEYNMPQKINNVFEIVSMDGKKIYQTDLTQDKGVVKWDVHSIIPGTYLYKIRSGKSEVCSGKVVVAK